MTFMGIDPGAQGGIAVVDVDGRVRQLVKLPTADGPLLQTIYGILAVETDIRTIVLEHVHPTGTNGSIANFRLGQSYGRCRLALTATGLTGYKTVAPVTWQNATGVDPGGKGADKTKLRTHRRATQLFGKQTRVTHWNADALLLAWCARLMTRI